MQCLATDIASCDCSKIRLEADTILFLEKTSYGCLCNTCLSEVNEQVVASKDVAYSTNGSQITEGIHYYMDGPYLVFTELYHIQKGYCCRNGCRHCAYGYVQNA
jgi:hypothetical protein